MRRFCTFFAAAWLAVAGAGPCANATPAGATGDPDNTYKYVINGQSYLWLLPQFWMKGEESFGYFRIENTLSYPISIYMHCHASGRSLAGMSGRFGIRPGGVKIVDSRKYSIGSEALLVRCSLKSGDRATVQYMIRDGRVRNFGDIWRPVQPEIS